MRFEIIIAGHYHDLIPKNDVFFEIKKRNTVTASIPVPSSDEGAPSMLAGSVQGRGSAPVPSYGSV